MKVKPSKNSSNLDTSEKPTIDTAAKLSQNESMVEAMENAGEFGSTSWRTSIKVAGKKKLIEEKWKFS